MQTLIKFIVTSFLIFVTGILPPNCAAESENENNVEIVPPRAPASSNIIVRLRDNPKGRARANILDRVGVARRQLGRRTVQAGTKSKIGTHLPDLTLVSFNNDREADAALAVLRKNPEILYAEPDYKVRIQLNSAGRIPNDFEFARQIGLLNDGSHGTKTNADIQAAMAWRTATGSRNIIVAVIDTGIDYYHPDLAPNIWTNTREIPGNGLDDDGNGFVDDLHGFDFVGNDSDPFDDNKHGSHVSGIIGAAGNNGIGIAGVCWEVSIMSVKAFGSDGSANLSDVLDAIDYAVANGANIINASWGLNSRSRSLEDAVMSAEKAGVLFIAAAGNDRTDSPFYPAAYTGVISVAATDGFDQRASFSNFGTNITVAAPGQDIYSTVPNSTYDFLSGTSMAAPHVSGLAALILSDHPDFSGENVRDIIVNTADPLQTDHPLGRGRINAASALQKAISLPKLAINVPGTLEGTFNVPGSAFGVQFKHFSLSVAVGKAGTNFVTISEGTDAVNPGLLATNTDSNAFPDGPCIFKLEAENAEDGKATLFAASSIANTAITEPLSNDILRAGELLEIRGRVPAGTLNFRIEYAPGLVPAAWTSIGIQLATKEEQLAGILARWDTSMVLSNEFYTLRLTTGDGKTTARANFVYLDQHLKPGWPKRNPIHGDFPIEDWRNVV
ncbi:MAG: hypothetical protein JWM99_910, partial [Verrucomicrobiales bacterium]|nr:hypothetical protein [Verrucomicrobiales bacterium]